MNVALLLTQGGPTLEGALLVLTRTTKFLFDALWNPAHQVPLPHSLDNGNFVLIHVRFL